MGFTNIEPKVESKGRYSHAETCRLLGISRPTLYRYMKAGKIRFGIRAINNKVYFVGQEITRAWKGEWGL